MFAASRFLPACRLFGIVMLLVAAAHGLSAQQAPGAAPDVVAVGCVAQPPDTPAAPPTGHEQGAARGLTLTRTTLSPSEGRAAGAPPRSAVPGSLPAGTGSGTTDAATGRTPAPVEHSFWLVGAKSAELTRFIGKRVEVTGTFDDRLAANPGTQRVTDAGASGRRATTAPGDTPATAHPSAPSRAISVVSFRVLDEACR
jgi:hypothetical protein